MLFILPTGFAEASVAGRPIPAKKTPQGRKS
jgi:hypothetical protein